MQFIQKVEGLTIYMEGDRENTEIEVAIYHSDENECEMHMEKEVFGFEVEGKCVTDHGIYFGTTDSHDPKFCPAHYFTGNGYVIEAKK